MFAFASLLWCEFIFKGDLWPEGDREAGKEEPDYIKTEREQFGNFRDLNKDGKMDRVCFIYCRFCL